MCEIFAKSRERGKEVMSHSMGLGAVFWKN